MPHLFPTYEERDVPSSIPSPVTDLSEMGTHRWHYFLWHLIIQATLDGLTDQVDLSCLPNVDGPAASRCGASTPQLLYWFELFNQAKTDGGRVRPFNFMQSLQLSMPKINFAIAEGRLVASVRKDFPAPVAPYNDKIGQTARICFDRKTGQPVPAKYLATYHEALTGYHLHSECTFANREGFNRGITERRHIEVIAIQYISKETNRWEERYHVGEMPEAQAELGPSESDRRGIVARLVPLAKKVSISALAVRAGIT